jgi:NADPH2:quinone reductase
MKALVCEEYGPVEKLQFKEVDDPTVGEGQLLIEVKAAGCNFPDALVIAGKYQIKLPVPFYPGSEGSGIVTAVGDNVSGYAVGDRVLFFTLSGAFAEQIVIAAADAIVIPDEMPYSIAAGFICAYGTGYHALKQRAGLQAGEHVLILGASGGLGSSAIQIARAMGAKVIACASSEAKLATCKELGADWLIDYTREDLKTAILEKTGRKDINVVYDPVGGDYSEKAFRCIAPQGRHLVLGFTAGNIPKIPLNLPLVKEASLIGVFWNSWILRHPDQHRKNMSDLFRLFGQGEIKPLISQTYPLENYEKAFHCLAERRAIGRIILTMGE